MTSSKGTGTTVRTNSTAKAGDLAIYSGALVQEFTKGDSLPMGDVARESGTHAETFERVCAPSEFDDWCLYQASRHLRVYLREAVPVVDLKEVTTSVNW